MIKRINNTVKCAVLCSALFTLSVGIVNAQSNLEGEFLSITNKYNQEDIIVENGISIRQGETLDLSQLSGWELSNNKTVEIDENGIMRPINEGTVYLSNEIDKKVYIIEVYVSNKLPQVHYDNEREINVVDRDYYKVFVDPGHGGSDNGASGFGLLEDELNLQISNIVEKKLKEKGIEVKMSRTSDKFIPLIERSEMANDYGADLFISIHQNSFEKESANGIETYYHTNKEDEKPYSDEIQNNTIKETGATNRGVKSANFSVIRESDMPSSLFESGFISNKSENSKLRDPIYQDKLASGIVNGIETYLKDNIKLTPQITTEKTLVKDIYKYDAGSGKYLTYINGKGYSQYSYLNKAGSYAFTPSSWIKAAGLDISMPTSDNGYTVSIKNNYMLKYNDAKDLLKSIKLGQKSQKEILTELSMIEDSFNQSETSINNIEEHTNAKSSYTKTLTDDIYKYDIGKGNYLTYINGKGYSQYSYVTSNGKYAFTPSSWMTVAGVDVTMPNSTNGYTMKINNPYIEKYDNVINEIKRSL